MQKAAKLGHAILLKLSSFVSDEGLQTWRYFDVCEIVPKSCQFFDSASGVRIDACLVFFKSTAVSSTTQNAFFGCIEMRRDIKNAFFSWGFSKKKASFM